MTKQAVLPLTWPHIKSDMPHTSVDKLLYFNHHWTISLYTCCLRPNNSMTITVNKWWLCNYLGPTYELPERKYPECASPLTLVRTEKVSIRLHLFFLKIYDLAVCVSISSFIVSSHVTSTFDNVSFGDKLSLYWFILLNDVGVKSKPRAVWAKHTHHSTIWVTHWSETELLYKA